MHSRYVRLCRACRVGVSHTDTTTPQEKWRPRSSASCSSQGAFVVHAKPQPKGGPHLRAKQRKTEGSVSRRQWYVCLISLSVIDFRRRTDRSFDFVCRETDPLSKTQSFKSASDPDNRRCASLDFCEILSVAWMGECDGGMG